MPHRNETVALGTFEHIEQEIRLALERAGAIGSVRNTAWGGDLLSIEQRIGGYSSRAIRHLDAPLPADTIKQILRDLDIKTPRLQDNTAAMMACVVSYCPVPDPVYQEASAAVLSRYADDWTEAMGRLQESHRFWVEHGIYSTPFLGLILDRPAAHWVSQGRLEMPRSALLAPAAGARATAGAGRRDGVHRNGDAQPSEDDQPGDLQTIHFLVRPFIAAPTITPESHEHKFVVADFRTRESRDHAWQRPELVTGDLPRLKVVSRQ